jgi:hypothetical protein
MATVIPTSVAELQRFQSGDKVEILCYHFHHGDTTRTIAAVLHIERTPRFYFQERTALGLVNWAKLAAMRQFTLAEPVHCPECRATHNTVLIISQGPTAKPILCGYEY